MSDRLRARLLETYRDNQGSLASPALYGDPHAAWPHFDENYRGLLADLGRGARVLELGAGPGQFLTWLRNEGFTNLTGVDASPGDVAHAAQELGGDVMQLGDAFAYARMHPGSFDLVVMKALLEHIPKDELLDALESTATALAPGGRLIVEVPNMDWVFGVHERYLDLTHEVGFTRQSLAVLLALCYGDVRVELSRLANPTRSQRLARPALLRLMRRALYVIGEGADDVAFGSRSLIAVASAPLS